MPGSWPEPFGLAAIEALATGRRSWPDGSAALPEIIRDGVDGFFGDDVTEPAFRVPDIESARSPGHPHLGHRAVLGEAA